jgi:hypothetical protein
MDKIPTTEFSVEERFQFMENYVQLVAKNEHNSLIISGDSGLGKSWRVMRVINSYNDLPYFLVKGFATARALYDTLYRHKNKLIVFDDCDSILEDKVAVNILKGALDSYEKRTISWLSKSADKSIPLQFDFNGRIIFISNKPLETFDKAIMSRSLSINVFMTKDEKIDEIIRLSMTNEYLPNITKGIKYNVALELVPYMDKESVNLRTLEKAIKAYIASDLNVRTIHYIGETA